MSGFSQATWGRPMPSFRSFGAPRGPQRGSFPIPPQQTGGFAEEEEEGPPSGLFGSTTASQFGDSDVVRSRLQQLQQQGQQRTPFFYSGGGYGLGNQGAGRSMNIPITELLRQRIQRIGGQNYGQ